MKFWKWFIEDSSSEEIVAREYAEMPDRRLMEINAADLTPIGLKCYRAELERRKGKTAGPKTAETTVAVP